MSKIRANLAIVMFYKSLETKNQCSFSKKFVENRRIKNPKQRNHVTKNYDNGTGDCKSSNLKRCFLSDKRQKMGLGSNSKLKKTKNLQISYRKKSQTNVLSDKQMRRENKNSSNYFIVKNDNKNEETLQLFDFSKTIKSMVEEKKIAKVQTFPLEQIPVQKENEEKNSESDSDDFIIENFNNTNYSYGQRYIDSGLRPHKEGESRLYLRNIVYKSPHVDEDEDNYKVQPLLKKLPSGLFKMVQPKKAEKIETSYSEDSIFSEREIVATNKDDLANVINKISRRESNNIDTTLLQKLQEYENIRYTIQIREDSEIKDDFQDNLKKSHSSSITNQLSSKQPQCSDVFTNNNNKQFDQSEENQFVNEKEQDALSSSSSSSIKSTRKQDFCVHSFEPPNGEFSSSSDQSVELEVTDAGTASAISLKRDLKKEDYCIHTFEPLNNQFFSSSLRNYDKSNKSTLLIQKEKSSSSMLNFKEKIKLKQRSKFNL